MMAHSPAQLFAGFSAEQHHGSRGTNKQNQNIYFLMIPLELELWNWFSLFNPTSQHELFSTEYTHVT